MADWSMVWLQQKGDEDQITTPRVPDPSKPLRPEVERSVTNLQRTTESRKAKLEPSAWMKRTKVLSYIQEDKYQWNKMALFTDCKRCMYTTDGAVRKSKKI